MLSDLGPTDPPIGRPPVGPRRTSPRTLIAAGVQIVTALGFIILDSVIRAAVPDSSSSNSDDSGSNGWFLGLVAAYLLIRGIVTLVGWLVRTYTVTDTELVIDSGILTRHHRVLPYARVQQADLTQNFTSQLLGITIVKVSSAGEAGATTVALSALERNDAEELREFILRRREELHAAEARPSAPPAPPAPTIAGPIPPGYVADGTATAAAGTWPAPPPSAIPSQSAGLFGQTNVGEEVLKLTPGRLLLATLTDFRVLAIPAVAVFATLWLTGFIVVSDSSFSSAAALGISAAALLVTALGLVPFIAASQLIDRYGFTVTVAGDDIHLRFGLFNLRQLTIPRQRVQQLTLVDNPLRRALGVTSLHLHSASVGMGTTSFEIPVINTADLDRFLFTLMGSETWRVPSLRPRVAKAQRRAVVRRVSLFFLALAGPAAMLRPFGPVLLLFAIAGAPWGFVAHRRAGHGTTQTVLSVSHGALHHRVDLVPIDRIQSCRVQTSPFQRRAGLGTFLVDVAAAQRPPRLFDMDDATARDLVQGLPRMSSPAAAVDQRF